MIPSDAEKITGLLRTEARRAGGYRIDERAHSTGAPLSGFHHWADGRACLGAFLVRPAQGEALWLLVIDWKSVRNYYIVLFPESRSGPIAEVHEVEGEGAELTLNWTYSPTKRDGKNEARRQYFVDSFHSTEVVISVPSSDRDTEAFLDELFSLAESRLKADELAPERPPTRETFPEGRLKEKLHLARERNADLVRKAKERAIAQHGALTCTCCNFDFAKRYGVLGAGFIEAHHTVPVSELHPDGEETRLEDIALVCSNCHRMLHRRRPWLELDELAQLLDDA